MIQSEGTNKNKGNTQIKGNFFIIVSLPKLLINKAFADRIHVSDCEWVPLGICRSMPSQKWPP